MQERAFVAAAERRATREARRRRVAGTAVVVVSLLVALATGWLWRQSEASRRQADREARRAEAGRLLALGQLELEDHPTLALARATASLELADTPEGRRVALRALAQGPPAWQLSAASGRGVRFSDDGRWLAVGGQEGLLEVWPRDGGAPVRLEGNVGNVFPLGFDGQKLITDERRGGASVRVWELPSGREVAGIDFGEVAHLEAYACGSDARVLALTQEKVSADLLFSWWSPGDDRATLAARRIFVNGWRTWRASPTCEQYAYVPMDTGLVRGIRFAEPGVADRDPTADPVILELPEEIGQIGWDRDGMRLAAATVDGSVTVRRLGADGDSADRRLPAGPIGAISLAFGPRGRALAAGTRRHVIGLWDLDGPPQASPLELRAGAVGFIWNLDIDPDGRWLAAATPSGTWLWPLTARAQVLRGHAEPTQVVRFLPGDAGLVSVGDDGLIRPWSLSPGVAVPAPVETRLASWALRLDASGQRVVVPFAGFTGVFATDGRQWWLAGPNNNVMDAAFDPTGRWVAAGSGLEDPSEAKVYLWDVAGSSTTERESATGDEFVRPTRFLDAGDGEGIYTVSFLSADRLLTGGRAGLRIWSLEDSSYEQVSAANVRHLEADARGRFVLHLDLQAGQSLSATGGSAAVEDLDTGTSLALPGYGDGVRSIAISPDGELVATGDMDGVIRVGQRAGGPPHLLLGHDGPVTSLAFSSDGSRLASTGQDTTVRLWPVPDLNEPPLHGLPAEALIERLHSLTNLRLVRDLESSDGWRLDVLPFPGWEGP